ncbi:retrovirus-related Pol polyprotein from transposon 17.6 [Nephila pilipes]|uniref:Retrovirus-related Pol polyprotein from transposon 17.6 n=1 Tax=Nephila pilipes TaxID=299642 RepID=A0A8X6PDG1_NEPPI|nr:retrovirus-related Pol polyprotein from transposon 17.6 [Nephila pilipes]
MINFSVRDQESSTSNIYKKIAFINGHKVTAILSTGTSSCFLKELDIKNLEPKILPCKENFYSFGNQSLNPVTQSLSMITDLQIEEALANNVDVFIVPDSPRPVDLLVGRQYIDLPRIAYAVIGGKLQMNYAKDYTFLNLNSV